MAAMLRTLEGRDHSFEIDELGRDAIRFRSNDVLESARFFRDGDRLYFLHRGVTHIGARSLTRGAGSVSGNG